MTTVVQRATGWLASRVERKLAVALFAALTVTSFIFLALFVAGYQRQLVDEHVRAAVQINQLLQASLENAMLKRDIPGLTEIVERLGQQSEIANVWIVNPRREIRFASKPQRIGEEFTDFAGWPHGTKPPVQISTFFLDDTDGMRVLRSINPVHNRQPCVQCHGDLGDNPVNGILVIDYKADTINRQAWSSAAILSGSGLVVAISTLIAAWFILQRSVLKPLAALERTSTSFASGNLEARARLPGRDEIAKLGNNFDNMADRLAANIKSLVNSERFVQAVINAVPDGIRVIDSDFRIIRVNDAYCQQVGAPRERIVGMPCYASSHQRSAPCPPTMFTCPLVQLARSNTGILKCQHKHLRPDGTPLFVEVTAASAELIVDGEARPCVIESIRDVANQVAFSHQDRLASLTVLATGVAHEIHNPLSSIQLALHALSSKQNQREADPTTLDYLATVNREIDHCISITDRLLRMSEPPSETAVLISLVDVVDDVISLLAYQMEQTGVTINVRFNGTPRTVAAESDMRLLVLNLVQNAFHAMPNGGTLTISGTADGANIVLIFADTGVGIEQADLEKIFWPFWTMRGDGSHGSGLGLSLCSATVERYRGTISVKSSPGKGAHFTVLLPNADIGNDNA